MAGLPNFGGRGGREGAGVLPAWPRLSRRPWTSRPRGPPNFARHKLLGHRDLGCCRTDLVGPGDPGLLTGGRLGEAEVDPSRGAGRDIGALRSSPACSEAPCCRGRGRKPACPAVPLSGDGSLSLERVQGCPQPRRGPDCGLQPPQVMYGAEGGPGAASCPLARPCLQESPGQAWGPRHPPAQPKPWQAFTKCAHGMPWLSWWRWPVACQEHPGFQGAKGDIQVGASCGHATIFWAQVHARVCMCVCARMHPSGVLCGHRGLAVVGTPMA